MTDTEPTTITRCSAWPIDKIRCDARASWFVDLRAATDRGPYFHFACDADRAELEKSFPNVQVQPIAEYRGGTQ